MIPTILAAAGLVIATEIAAWWLFSRRIEGLTFPAAADGSDLPFFTVQRLRLLALLHAAVLVGIVTFILLWLW